MEATYTGFRMWTQAVAKAGTTAVDAVREAMYGQKVNAPCGYEEEMHRNHHLSKPVMIGEIAGRRPVQHRLEDAGRHPGGELVALHPGERQPAPGLTADGGAGPRRRRPSRTGTHDTYCISYCCCCSPSPCRRRRSRRRTPSTPRSPASRGNFNQQAEAVERLGALGDPRAVPVLRAMADGPLRAADGAL